MSYVLVEDIAASWEAYRAIARSFGPAPAGLLLHVAGPTDEGFRIIEVWETEDAWRRYSAGLAATQRIVDPIAGNRVTVRDLRPVHVVIGEAWQGSAPGAER